MSTALKDTLEAVATRAVLIGGAMASTAMWIGLIRYLMSAA